MGYIMKWKLKFYILEADLLASRRNERTVIDCSGHRVTSLNPIHELTRRSNL
jgi:hypothetical protein